MSLKTGDIIICTVKRIEPSCVFVETEDKEEASILMPEIAAGRIRNLREYVAPNKRIVCKILSDAPSHIQLSLRRVTAKEREETLKKYQKEKTLIALIKAITKNPEEIISSIKKSYDIVEFFDEVRENPKILENFFNKKEEEQITKNLKEKENITKKAKKKFLIRTMSENGLEEIKKILNIKEAEINYLGSNQFSIKISAKDFKEANNKLNIIIKEIENKSKEKKMLFEVKE